jgi:glyceraldehyde 3-phosphate dehydrogenase
MSIRIAINGFGRIGRAVFHLASERDDIEVVAINDLGDIENLAYLLRHDTVYGPARNIIETKKVDEWRTVLVVDDREVPIYKEKDPAALPWRDLQVDIVIESTGHFTDYAKAKVHLDAGAKRVVISAPAKGSVEGIDTGTVLMGINEGRLSTCVITSNGSCTTNATSPVVQVLEETIGIEKAMLNTVHAYTATQQLVDGGDAGDWRRGRAAAQNIVPSTTGAAQSVTEAVTSLAGKFDGISLRVPVPVGSIADITSLAKRGTRARWQRSRVSARRSSTSTSRRTERLSPKCETSSFTTLVSVVPQAPSRLDWADLPTSSTSSVRTRRRHCWLP